MKYPEELGRLPKNSPAASCVIRAVQLMQPTPLFSPPRQTTPFARASEPIDFRSPLPTRKSLSLSLSLSLPLSCVPYRLIITPLPCRREGKRGRERKRIRRNLARCTKRNTHTLCCSAAPATPCSLAPTSVCIQQRWLARSLSLPLHATIHKNSPPRAIQRASARKNSLRCTGIHPHTDTHTREGQRTEKKSERDDDDLLDRERESLVPHPREADTPTRRHARTQPTQTRIYDSPVLLLELPELGVDVECPAEVGLPLLVPVLGQVAQPVEQLLALLEQVAELDDDLALVLVHAPRSPAATRSAGAAGHHDHLPGAAGVAAAPATTAAACTAATAGEGSAATATAARAAAAAAARVAAAAAALRDNAATARAALMVVLLLTRAASLVLVVTVVVRVVRRRRLVMMGMMVVGGGGGVVMMMLMMLVVGGLLRSVGMEEQKLLLVVVGATAATTAVVVILVAPQLVGLLPLILVSAATTDSRPRCRRCRRSARIYMAHTRTRPPLSLSPYVQRSARAQPSERVICTVEYAPSACTPTMYMTES